MLFRIVRYAFDSRHLRVGGYQRGGDPLQCFPSLHHCFLQRLCHCRALGLSLIHIYLKDPSSTIKQHTNVFSEEYLNYLSQIDPSVCSSVGLTRIVNMNLLRETEEGAVPVTFSSRCV